ncbi:GNAT family N-acetyltransferase [Veillonella criceti]|uniref:Uncharacterized N-acetyltransferase YtmI n=1 Tax=Veillonella criceti TaxID=103891 RepID=A0A380NN83_9FIRM|nr:GNAT family N-acetyltransferase [Veillonella criceti]SUP44797.1 Uncharacterized N-acetyltransferase YtmI [Veillonella criceti]
MSQTDVDNQNMDKQVKSIRIESLDNLTYRQLTEADGAVYYQVLHEGYASNLEYGVDFSASHMTEVDATAWLREHPTYGLFVAEQLASSITLRMPWGPKPGPREYPHIGHFVTSPHFKNQGYAKKLLQWLESEVLHNQLKAPLVTLGTADTHPWLKDMYISLGFTITKVMQLPGLTHQTIYFEKKISQ